MRIVSVSRRTDIPAFYVPWLMNRLRAGSVRVPNPFNRHQVASIGLSPGQVTGLVFWTRDPRPLLPHLDELDARGYRTLFHITLTGLPAQLEPRVPPQEAIVAAIRALSRRYGADRVVWRFDPLILPPLVPAARTAAVFSDLSAALAGSVERVVTSIARPYVQVRSRLRRHGLELADLSVLTPEGLQQRVGPLLSAVADIAGRHGMRVFACAEKADFSSFGIERARCIDPVLWRNAFGLQLPEKKDAGQRPECGCLPSTDIGIYGTCRHGCLYCYAAGGCALERGAVHDPHAAVLVRDGREAPEPPTLFC